MFCLLNRVVVSIVLLALTLSVSAQEKPSKVEIGKRGKAATAFVDVPRRGTGTAFCAHPNGLFITNEHVVRGAEKEEITLVLNPAVEDQRVLKAKVVRIDKALDLALLRVDGAKELPSLPLGSIKGVAELADVVACGFPLGFALSTEKEKYPAISVNAGSVTALRYKDRELQHLQIDVAVTFGNSGGPVLDEHGNVIGVVVRGIGGGGKGLNQAIPVSHLDGFLKRPDIAFTPSALTREMLAKPIEFQAGIVSFVADAQEPTLKLVLKPDDDEPRETLMTKRGEHWVATMTPVAKTGAARVEITARIGTATVTGTTEDAVFKVAGKPIRLSGVRRIEFKDKNSVLVLLADSRTTVEGEVVGLGIVEIDLAGQKVKIDLAKATQVTVQAAPEVVSVLASVLAIVDGKEVARSESHLIIREAIESAPADPSTVKITPPALSDEKVVKRLPELFSDVVVGGGGRYLIFHLPKLKKLAVFDVNEARVTKYLSLTEEDVTFAAGLDAIVIGLKKSGKLERWSLTTFELEKTAFPPFKDDIKMVLMGHASKGPVVVNGEFLDLESFKLLPIKRAWEAEARPYVSGDGTVFARWGGNSRNSVTHVLDGGEVRRNEEGNLGHVLPGPDGKTVFTAKGVLSRLLKRNEPEDASYGYCVPAVRGDYFLSITPAPPGGAGGSFNIYLRGLTQPIAKLDQVNHGLHFDSAGFDSYAMWSRVVFVPDAKFIALLPRGNDQVVLYKFDADAALVSSGLDYLIVTSTAPREVRAGATFTYSIKARSKQGGVTYKLDSGPKGMTVSIDGVVTWNVSGDSPIGDQDVILTVRDKVGQEVFHTFTIKVVK